MGRVLGAAALLLFAAAPVCAEIDCEAARCAVREMIDAQCGCADAATHGGYVSCVARVVRELVLAGTLPVECKGKVRRCAARSVCGKRPGFVVCDLPVRCPAGTCSRCRLAPSAERCLARGGTVATRPSCCPSCGPAAPIACGPGLTCDPGKELCVAREPVGPAILYECRPVPAGCEYDRTCRCAGSSLCAPPFDVCSDSAPGAITCVCPECQ
jgi:hypothetical protein